MKQLRLSAGFNINSLLTQLVANNAILQNRISLTLACICIAISGWVCGQLVWLFQPSSTSITQWQPVVVSTGNSSDTKNQYDLKKVHESNFFGRYNAATAPVTENQQVVNRNAPKTRLNLVLVGAVSSSNAKDSLAVIANSGKQSTYGIGEQIDGTRAKLKAVMVDRVIIDNVGRDETLMLEGVKDEQQQVSQREISDAESDKLDKIKQDITHDPKKIFQYVRLSEVKNGDAIVGYRLSPGREPALFNELGLKAGDIAVELNGFDLTAGPSVLGQIMASMKDLTELDLIVERDGQQENIYIQL